VNTLTLIKAVGGFVFGGFTPVEWESRSTNCWYQVDCYKSDDSLKSFLFTLVNPHDIPARKFALKAEKKEKAIYCDYTRGPVFDDMLVDGNCNENTNSWTELGSGLGGAYTNDTGLPGDKVFTGSWHFKVKEIEVFEITD
jgi:hypothetical protein